MARRVTRENERLDQICLEAYGAVTSRGLASITLSSPAWRGQGIFYTGEVLEVPELELEVVYNTETSSEIDDLRRRLDGLPEEET